LTTTEWKTGFFPVIASFPAKIAFSRRADAGIRGAVAGIRRAVAGIGGVVAGIGGAVAGTGGVVAGTGGAVAGIRGTVASIRGVVATSGGKVRGTDGPQRMAGRRCGSLAPPSGERARVRGSAKHHLTPTLSPNSVGGEGN